MPERSLLLKAIEEMDDETLKPEKVRGPVKSESEKKTNAGDFFGFRRWIQNRCNYMVTTEHLREVLRVV